MGDSALEPNVPPGHDLGILQETMAAWRAHNFEKTSTAEHQALGVAEECGELCHAVLKAAQGIRGDVAEHREAAADAVGDIIIYLTGVCDALELDIATCVRNAALEVLERDWITYPGNGRTE